MNLQKIDRFFCRRLITSEPRVIVKDDETGPDLIFTCVTSTGRFHLNTIEFTHFVPQDDDVAIASQVESIGFISSGAYGKIHEFKQVRVADSQHAASRREVLKPVLI